MKKSALILLASTISNSLVYAQIFTPKIENINTSHFTYKELQKTGCPIPPINIQIIPDIASVVWDYSLRSRELKNISTQPGQVVGLHKASTSINVQSQVYYLTDNLGNQTCFTIWPSHVNIKLQSKIYISSEISRLNCSKNNTENHELEHQKVAIWALSEAQNMLYKELNENFKKPMYFNTYADSQSYYNNIISNLQNRFITKYNNIANPLNSQLDSNENYALENKKCLSDLTTLAYYLSV